MTSGGWKLARRGALAAQMPLAMCIVLAVVIALLGRAEASIFQTARATLTDWTAPALEQMRSPLAGFETFVGGAGNIFSVYSDNARLRRENAELKKWQDVALRLEQRTRRYELLLDAVPDPTLETRTARVIGQSNRPFIKTIVLNGGSNHGVEKGQAVMDDRGLIGRIYLAGHHTSWVLLLSDPSSRVPVVVQPSNRRAIVAGDNSNAPRLELDDGDAPIKAGDRVVSTGDGGLLPPDLLIGTVVRDGGTLRVALFADPDISDYVKVVSWTPHLQPPTPLIGEMPPVHKPAPAPAPLPPVASLPATVVTRPVTVAAPAAPVATPAATVAAQNDH